ncbi:hypothetical protein G3A39_39580 [Paraburkholderia aspalathi]|nr:hypothetical protein [Paraburkholderia aspalathi]
MGLASFNQARRLAAEKAKKVRDNAGRVERETAEQKAREEQQRNANEAKERAEREKAEAIAKAEAEAKAAHEQAEREQQEHDAEAKRLAAEKAKVHPAEPVGPQFDGIGTDSGEQFSDAQLRQAIAAVTGTTPGNATKRETLIERFNELNLEAAKSQEGE